MGIVKNINIQELQENWGENIIKLGKMNKEEQESNIFDVLNKLYAYDTSNICFKPTMKDDISRYNSIEGARDYFLGATIKDKGFVNNKWTEILFNTNETIKLDDCMISNGTYYFNKPHENIFIKAFYTMVFNKTGQLIVHHSSLPVE